MGYGKNWQSIAKVFSKDFHVLIYDQRGHGKSIQPDSGYGPEDFAQDLKHILEELSWDKIHLVGHSMGGRNAINFAYQWPNLVERLIIEDIGPETSDEAVQEIFDILDKADMPFSSKNEAKEHLFAVFSHNMVLANYLYANVEEKAENQVAWRFSESAIRQSVEQGRAKERWFELEALQMPTLVIRGELSEELSVEVFERMKACNSLITGVEIAQAKHWVHYDQTREFIRVIKAFLLAGED